MVFDASRLSIVDTGKLTDLTIKTAQDISARITQNAIKRADELNNPVVGKF